jgi:ABC-type transporter Mla subunit MlaD
VTAPANRWKLGLFVVAGVAASITGLTWIGMHELKRDFHVAYAYFDEALTGLEDGSPVKFRGASIGVVQEIRVAEDKKHLRVKAAIYDDYLRDLGFDPKVIGTGSALPPNLRAQVVMSWVTSTAFIQVDFFPDPLSGAQQLPFPVPSDQNTLRTLAARELIELLRTELQAAALPAVAKELRAVLARADGLLQAAEKGDVVGVAGSAMQAVREGAESLRDPNAPLGAAVVEVRQLLAQLQQQVAAAELAATSKDLRTAATAFGGASVALTDAIGQLRGTLAAVERLATLLERDPGALLYGRGAGSSPLPEVRR